MTGLEIKKKGEAVILKRCMQDKVYMCEQRTEGKDLHYFIFKKQPGHLWITLEEMEKQVAIFNDIIKINGKQSKKSKE